MNEQEAKEEARERKGDLLDSLVITQGSAAKGISVAIKTYYDASKIEEAQTKVENTLKIRTYLMKMGVIQ